MDNYKGDDKSSRGNDSCSGCGDSALHCSKAIQPSYLISKLQINAFHSPSDATFLTKTLNDCTQQKKLPNFKNKLVHGTPFPHGAT